MAIRLEKKRPITACKRHNPAAGATQGYDRLQAKRYRKVRSTHSPKLANQIVH